MLKRVFASLRNRAAAERSFLNVGGGSKRVPVPEHYAGWKHVLLDVNPAGGVDIALDARKLGQLPPATFDAVYCSHNLEHYYTHEVPVVLAGFAHVLNEDGFIELRVPDLAAVMAQAVRRGLDIEDALYKSPAGPISVRDVLYGLGSEIARGNAYYAHKTGFTEPSLRRLLAAAGFDHVHMLASIGVLEVHVAAFRGPPSDEARSLLGLQGA
jgi:hypothetical protein